MTKMTLDEVIAEMDEFFPDHSPEPAATTEEELVATVTSAMGTGIETVADEAKRMAMEARRKEREAEREKLEELRIENVGEAARLIRAGALLIGEAGEKLVASGKVGYLPEALQTFLKNVMELEQDYQRELAGLAPSEREEEEVPELLTNFLKRSELEKAETRAREEAEALAARVAEEERIRIASASRHSGYEDDDDDDDDAPATLSEGDAEFRRRQEEEQKKIDELFNIDII